MGEVILLAKNGNPPLEEPHDGLVQHQPIGGHEIVRAGVAAMARLVCGNSWVDWTLVMGALSVGRAWAASEAGGETSGRRYTAAFGKWLRLHPEFESIHKADRSRFHECFKNLEAIEIWREAQPPQWRLKLNYPVTVLAHWKASLVPESENEDEADENKDTGPAATTITVADVLTWLSRASQEDKRQVAVALAKDTAAMKAILPAKALPPKATPKQVYDRAMALLSAEETPPVTH